MSPPVPLSGLVKESFAYKTIKDRLPVILTRVIDHLCREKLTIVAEYGEVASDEIKQIIGKLSQLKNEMQTNKPLRLFEECENNNIFDDTSEYNRAILEYQTNEQQPRWFTAPWLLVECYMYKAIHCSLDKTISLRKYDPFLKEKMKSLHQAKEAIDSLQDYTFFMLRELDGGGSINVGDLLTEMLQLSVWGNQCDLSITAGESLSPNVEVSSEDSITERRDGFRAALRKLSSNLLVDDSTKVFDVLHSQEVTDRSLALVLDNSGYELIGDVCLSLILLKAGLTSSISVYVKTRPWFVSDTLAPDIDITINWLRSEGFQDLANVWSDMISSKKWNVREHKFWTTPHAFPKMRESSPELFEELAQHSLIIFKGDLSYRKLVSDLDWSPTGTSFSEAIGPLRDLGPVLALRTVKGGPVVGVADTIMSDVIKRLGREDWYTTGVCGMIQLSTPDHSPS